MLPEKPLVEVLLDMVTYRTLEYGRGGSRHLVVLAYELTNFGKVIAVNHIRIILRAVGHVKSYKAAQCNSR